MTRAYNIGATRIVEIVAEPDDKCELCGKVDELRPYGPGGKRVCFDCGMKDQAETERRFAMLLNGDAP